MPDEITHTPAEENLWYELAIMSNASEPSNHIWNGYMRFLMENNGKSTEADEIKVRVIQNDGKNDYQEVGLPKLTPDELKNVQAIGLPGDMDQMSFEGCGFDENTDFASFYFPTDVSFKNANFRCKANFVNASFASEADFKNASFKSEANFKNASFASEADFKNASFANEVRFVDASFKSEAHFVDASFEGNANFWDASFVSKAFFNNASFASKAFFNNASFPNEAFFNNASFANEAYFVDASFANEAYFVDASFVDLADFSKTKFKSKAHFVDASFEGNANFKNASFGSNADFNNTSFAGWAFFINASFASGTFFTDASFASNADFKNASFASGTFFTDASFASNADFKNASFWGNANFSKAEFAGDADFSASSDIPPHKGSVSFANATFKLAPSFFERKLHEDTDWQGVTWPEPSSKEQAGIYVRRYERLSLMMSKLEKYDDKHRFFRSSMRAKEIYDGRWSVVSLISRIYGTLSDYGRGVGRAFGLWAVHIFLGAIFINCLLQSIGFKESFALSFSNAHRFIGLHSGALENLYKDAGYIPWFNVIWGVQTVIGLPLLFFLLLTLRNRFRMR